MEASLLKAAFIMAATGLIIFLAFPPTKVLSKFVKVVVNSKSEHNKIA